MSEETTSPYAPKLPQPPIICSDQPGTWAYDTMSRRVDEEILERTVTDIADDLAKWTASGEEQIQQRIQDLRQQLRTSAILPPLEPPHDPHDTALVKEWKEWTSILEPYQNDTWLTAPWIVAEFYVYRRLMAALDYWNPVSPAYQYDPFCTAKRKGLAASIASAQSCLTRVLPHTSSGLAVAVSIALWGNQMDLSLWPAADDDNDQQDTFARVLEAAADQLLADDTEALTKYCEKLKNERGGGNIDIIVDNAGFELVTDLVLAQFLVQAGYAKTVTFQTKAHPTFVSDALTKDVLETVQYYADSDVPACAAAGQQWTTLLKTGQWRCHQDYFWVQPTSMWAMTEPLRSTMQAHTDLAFVKGDANYRRLLGDRQWNVSADAFGDVVGKFPVPVCALRTLKAELGCGMDADKVAAAAQRDSAWMTNGQFGVIQFSLCDE